MSTQEFFTLLQQHQDKALLFQYAPNLFVGANYHITEVKHVKIDSVDCGSQTDSWNETIIQLWENPLEVEKTTFMNVTKASAILKEVGKAKAYDLNAEVKFEYSNDTFHTSQLFVRDILVKEHELIINLGLEKTDCKAKELCGIPETILNTGKTTISKIESCCTPESGCC
ncbi:MAG: DUF6428 family protein [Psychroserpens sp.]|uniref:DUF6428 family protein n=1 Tax=Psychroserpens sp. TaxID=2020870 RepID=UPI003C7949F7